MYEGLCDTHSAYGHQHGRPLPELAPDDALQTTTPRSLCHGPLLQVIHIIYIIYIQIYDIYILVGLPGFARLQYLDVSLPMLKQHL